MREETVQLNDQEKAVLQQLANLRGVTLEEAASQLTSDGIEQRYRRKTGRGPANNVKKMRHAP